jgi:hypothetical protein
MMTRNGQMMCIGDTIEVLQAIDILIRQGDIQEAHAYVQTAHHAMTQMAHGWVRADAAYSVLAKSLKRLPEDLSRERIADDPEPEPS